MILLMGKVASSLIWTTELMRQMFSSGNQIHYKETYTSSKQWRSKCTTVYFQKEYDCINSILRYRSLRSHWSFGYSKGTVGNTSLFTSGWRIIKFYIWLDSTTFFGIYIFTRLRARSVLKGVMRKACRASNGWPEKMRKKQKNKTKWQQYIFIWSMYWKIPWFYITFDIQSTVQKWHDIISNTNVMKSWYNYNRNHSLQWYFDFYTNNIYFIWRDGIMFINIHNKDDKIGDTLYVSLYHTAKYRH